MKKHIYFIILFFIVTDAFSQAMRMPKRVVFLIGDGMGLAQISAVMSEYKGRNAFERFKTIGLSKTGSADDYVTDSGAGATVFTIGKKTYNGAIGVGADSMAYENLFEKLKKVNYGTGIVVTSSVTHATPAAFYAHVSSRRSEEEIANYLLKGTCDIAIGGGIRFFKNRSDKQNLIPACNKAGITTIIDSGTIYKKQSATKLLYLAADNGMKTMKEGRGDFLVKASENVMQLLSLKQSGYMLMIEGSQIDWGGHAMDYEYMKTELIDFNETINMVLDQAQHDSDMLVIVTADHETGGLTLLENKESPKSFKPNYTYSHHTGIMVPVFAYGAGSYMFSGIYENTEVFEKLKLLLQLK